MNDSATLLNTLPANHADALIRAHDGNIALLYIWLSKNKIMDYESAAADLCLTVTEIKAADEKLRRLNLSLSGQHDPQSSVVPREKLPAADELPDYNVADIRARSSNNEEFQSVIKETAKVLGHSLSSSELVKLFGIYDYLSLPAEVIFLLINYCAEKTVERFGASKRTSFRTIEKEAFYWANNGLTTIEQAEQHINLQKELDSSAEKVKEAFGIRGRALTDTERKYIYAWLSLGFDTDCLYEAYDRTVTKTGNLSWPYLDKIVRSWNEKGFKTLQEIREKDSRTDSRQNRRGTSGTPAVTPNDISDFIKDNKQ